MQDWRLTARQLVELFEQARPLPLMRELVRIDKRDADDLAAAIEAGVRDAVDRGTLGKEAGYTVLSVTAQIREVLRNAPPVPLTDQVRVSRSRAHDLVRALLAVAGE